MAPGEEGRVTYIVDGDTLVLESGLSVRMVGLEAPLPERRDREGQPHAREASRLLEDMALGRRVKLYYPGVTRDRYDRALAHVRTADGLGPQYWLNEEVLLQGGARARFYPDTDRGAAGLLAAEREARERRAGLWNRAGYRPVRATEIEAGQTGFVLLRGVLGPREPPDRHRGICDRPLLGSPVRLEVAPGAGVWCEAEAGRWVEARGWLRSGGGLDVNHRMHVVLEEGQAD